MAISEFTRVVLDIAAEHADYRKQAVKKGNIPLMEQSVSKQAARNNMQTSSREERQRILREKGTKGALGMYKGVYQ